MVAGCGRCGIRKRVDCASECLSDVTVAGVVAVLDDQPTAYDDVCHVGRGRGEDEMLDCNLVTYLKPGAAA